MKNFSGKEPDKLKKQYQQELRENVNKTGMSQRELAKLTVYFQIRGSDNTNGKNQLSESTFTRTLQDIPSKNGVYNLMAILGVLYMEGQIDYPGIKNFIEKYDIPVPKNDPWETIFEQIEQGVRRGREKKSVSENTKVSLGSLGKNIRKRLLNWPRILFFIILSLITIFVLFIVMLERNNVISPNPETNCSNRFPETAPIFLPDQGFSQFQAVSDFPTTSILSNSIRSISLHTDGMWVGYSPTVGSLDRISHYTKDASQNYWIHLCLGISLLPSQNVNDFAFKDDQIYIATDGEGVGKFQDDYWRFYTQADGLPSNSVYALSFDKDGNLWASTYKGVAKQNRNQSAWETVYQAEPNKLISNHVVDYLEDVEGNHWFATLDRGIGRLSSSNQWYSYFSDNPNLNETRGVTADLNHGLWFSTEKGGVLYFNNDTWTIFNVANGQLPSNSVHNIELDKFGRVWVATARGLVYTSDFGKTWKKHSSMDTLEVKFGCENCIYNEDHMWLVLNNQGLGHVRIPPQIPITEFIVSPLPVILKPREPYVFKVSVKVIAEGLNQDDGDSLRSIASKDSFLYGAYPIIPITGKIPIGGVFTFTNVDNPIIAPDQPGSYELEWRVWQGRRFVSDPITVKFEVK